MSFDSEESAVVQANSQRISIEDFRANDESIMSTTKSTQRRRVILDGEEDAPRNDGDDEENEDDESAWNLS